MATIYAYGQAPEQALQALKEAMRLNATHPAVAHNAQALASGVQEGVLLFRSGLDLGRKAWHETMFGTTTQRPTHRVDSMSG